MVIVMRFLKEYKIVGVAIVVIVAASDWCSIWPFCHRSRMATIICEIAHQIATIRLLLNGWPFYLLVTLLWLRHVVILRFVLSLIFFMNVYGWVCLFRLRPFIKFENLMFSSFTDLQWKPGDFMAWINAIKYALNGHKKWQSPCFFLLCLLAGWMTGWLATSYPFQMAIFRTKITTLKPSTTLTK